MTKPANMDKCAYYSLFADRILRLNLRHNLCLERVVEVLLSLKAVSGPEKFSATMKKWHRHKRLGANNLFLSYIEDTIEKFGSLNSTGM